MTPAGTGRYISDDIYIPADEEEDLAAAGTSKQHKLGP